MANYNKSFNFRNGVQVDEDDLIVRNSLVGIGTTIPRAELDVYGTIKSEGIITARNVYVTGIATFNDVQIGTGITIIGNSGIIAAKFFGDGAGLYNIPTSQWVDVDPAVFAPLPPPPGAGTGYTSIYASGIVGIGTTIPRYYLQVGGTPDLGQNGVGIDSIGNAYVSGILTSGYFVGFGSGLTELNASNISLGTLDNSRLPSDISISGVITAATFNGQIISNNATITDLTSTNLSGTIGTISTFNSTNGTITNLSGTIGTITDLTSTNLSGTIGTISTFNSTNGTISNLSGTIGTITTLTGTDLNYTGVATVGIFTASSVTISNLSGTIGTITTLTGTDLNYTGVATVGIFTATQAIIGVLTATNIKSASVQLGVTAANQVDTSSGNLVLDSDGGLVNINDNIDVLGTSILQGEVTVNTGLVPDTSTGAYLGKTGKQFLEAWVGDLKIASGVGNSNKIETVSQDLVLDSNTNQVTVDANLSVAGVSTLSGNLTLGAGIEPVVDLGATLGSSLKRFSSSQIGGIRIGVAQTFEIDTISGTDLVLNSSSGQTRINDDVFVSGISSFNGEITTVLGIVPEESKGAYIGTSGKPFAEAFINEIRIGNSATNKIDTRTGPLLLNSADNLVNVENNLYVSGITTLSDNLTVGNNNQFFIDTFNNRVGIGTNILTRLFEVKSVSDLITEFRSDTGSVTIGIGKSSVESGQDVGKLLYSTSTNSFSIINEDLGGIEFISHSGNPGINTGNFSWVHGQTNVQLMSLTCDGKLGLGITNPSNTLYVVGTSTVTEKAFFGDDVEIFGNLNVQGDFPPSIVTNINTSVGVSTFREIQTSGNIIVAAGSSISFENQTPVADLDAQNKTGLFGSIGIRTDNAQLSFQYFSGGDPNPYTTNVNFLVEGSSVLKNVSIGNTNTLDLGYDLVITPGTSLIKSNVLSGVNSTTVLLDKTCALGVGTDSAHAAVDFRDAGKDNNNGIGAFMIIPTLNSTQRAGLATYEGAVIFNTSTAKFQGFTGTSWVDFH